MKFGDRFSARNFNILKARQRRYWAHLKALNLPDDIIYPFALEVFHDSPVTGVKIDLGKKKLKIRLQNMTLIHDLVDHGLDINSLRPTTSFSQILTFQNVDLFQGRMFYKKRGGCTYFQSEIRSFDHGRVDLTMFFRSDEEFLISPSPLRIVFSTLELEKVRAQHGMDEQLIDSLLEQQKKWAVQYVCES